MGVDICATISCMYRTLLTSKRAPVYLWEVAVLPSEMVGIEIWMHVGLNMVVGQWMLFRKVARGLHLEKCT